MSTDTPQDRREVKPEVEDIVDWLLDKSDFAEGPSLRSIRGAIVSAYERGLAARSESAAITPDLQDGGKERTGDKNVPQMVSEAIGQAQSLVRYAKENPGFIPETVCTSRELLMSKAILALHADNMMLGAPPSATVPPIYADALDSLIELVRLKRIKDRMEQAAIPGGPNNAELTDLEQDYKASKSGAWDYAKSVVDACARSDGSAA